MAKSKNFVREIIIDAGPNGTGDITVGGAVSKYNKTFDEAGFQVGDKGTCVIIDDTLTSYELLQVEMIAAGKFKRNKLLEQKKDGVFVPEPKTPLALTEAAYIYLTVTAEEIQEVILAAAIAADGDASDTALSASQAAASALAAGNSAESAKTSAASADKYKTDMDNLKVAGQKTLASLQAQEQAVIATIGGGWGAITHKLTAATDIKAIVLHDLKNDTDFGYSRNKDGSQSWCREVLGTAFRGDRLDRPAIQPGIVTDYAVKLYDGSRSDPSNWMVFTGAADDSILGWPDTVHTCIAAKDGIMYAGSQYGLAKMDFVTDKAFRWRPGNGYSCAGDFNGTLSERNSSKGYAKNIPATAFIVDNNVNDVAVTVLPGAEIDAVRGLPYQTVAVATEAGASIINPTGTAADEHKVVDVTFSANIATRYVAFDGDGLLYLSQRTVGEGSAYIHVLNIPETDTQLISGENCIVNGSAGADGILLRVPSGVKLFKSAVLGGKVSATEKGLVYFDLDISNLPNSLQGYMTGTYFTGVMLGDTSLCLMADTTTETITAEELVATGTFDADRDWTKGVAWSISGGAALGVSDGSYSALEQVLSGTIGKTYALTFTLSAAAGLSSNDFIVSLDGRAASFTADGTYTLYATLTTATPTLSCRFTNGSGSGATVTIDNVSVKEVIPDRSGKGNHAQIIGSITKSPVAAGAELVWWSGFSDVNHAKVTFSSTLSPGTRDFYCAGLFKCISSAGRNQALFSRRDTAGFRGYIGVNTGHLTFVTAAGAVVTVEHAYDYADGQPHHFVMMRSGSTMYLFVDGVLQGTAEQTGDLSGTAPNFEIGAYSLDASQYSNGTSLALLRYGRTAMTPEQIRIAAKIELAMTLPGATASLEIQHNITCIDYDLSNGRAYLGTAGGGTVVIDVNTMQRLEIISSVGYPDFTSDNVVSISAARGGWLIGTDQEAVFYDPPIAIRERG